MYNFWPILMKSADETTKHGMAKLSYILKLVRYFISRVGLTGIYHKTFSQSVTLKILFGVLLERWPDFRG